MTSSESSSSHFVFILNATSIDPEGVMRTGKIVLCDLAGSEDKYKNKPMLVADARKEAVEVKKSLTAFTDVMEAVCKRQQMVPFRKHKLTQILQDCLGGENAKCIAIINLCPASCDIDESVKSCQFAAKMQSIPMAPAR